MTENVISLFDCYAAVRGDQLSVIPVAVEEKIITVTESVQTVYTYVEHVARRLTKWITITAELFCRTVASILRAFRQRTVCLTGVQLLRKIVILRF